MLPTMISQIKWLHLFVMLFTLSFVSEPNHVQQGSVKKNVGHASVNQVSKVPPPAVSTTQPKQLTYLDQFESVEVVATGYTAGVESTGKKPNHPEYGITSSGVKVRKGTVSTIAADPKVFPMGTLLFIPGYGYGVVADTGSAIKGKKIDLYFLTRSQVFQQWGKKNVKVYVLKKGDGKVTESMLDRLNAIKAFAEEPSYLTNKSEM